MANVVLFKTAKTKKEIGMIVSKENPTQAYDYISHLLPNSNMMISPMFVIQPEGMTEGTYAFEVEYTTDMENELIDAFEGCDVDLYPVQMFKSDSIETVKKTTRTDLYVGTEKIKTGSQKEMYIIAEKLARAYNVFWKKTIKAEPSFVPLTEEFLIRGEEDEVALVTGDTLVQALSYLIGGIENESITGEKFYYKQVNERYYVYEESQLIHLSKLSDNEKWMVVRTMSDGKMLAADVNTHEEVLDFLQDLKFNGQDMNYVTIYAPNTSVPLDRITLTN